MKKEKNTSTKHSNPSQKQSMSHEELEEKLSKAFGEPITLERPTKDQTTKKGTSIDVTFIKHSGRKKTEK